MDSFKTPKKQPAPTSTNAPERPLREPSTPIEVVPFDFQCDQSVPPPAAPPRVRVNLMKLGEFRYQVLDGEVSAKSWKTSCGWNT